jgi:hypothetical protein
VFKVNIDGDFVIKEKMGARGFVVISNDGQAVMVGAGDALCAEIKRVTRSSELLQTS